MQQPDTLVETIEQTPEHLHVLLPKSRRVLSSAPFNGGLIDTDRLLILKVADNLNGAKGPFEPLEQTFKRYCRQKGWVGPTVGMMTSAQMTSSRQVAQQNGSVEITVLLTAGVSNARRAGDRAEYRSFEPPETGAGTINIIVLTNAVLSHAALVETVMIVTEAKAAAMQDLCINSPISTKTATGTGTDAVAVVNGWMTPKVRFCGKHTLFGEMVATATMEAISSSLQKN